MILKGIIGLIFVCLTVSSALAQATAFSYQGRLVEAGAPVTGNRLFRFTLFDENGAAIPGASVEQVLTVTNGAFTTSLDFGAATFPGADRTVEIAVKINAGDAYTVLNPRQAVLSAPYSIRSKSSENADKLGGIDASEYVTTTTAGNSFIKNDTVQQTANFNVSGDGYVGGNFGIGTTKPQSKLSVNTNGYGLTHTNGTVTVGSFLTTGSGWLGTRSNHPLNFFTNDGAAQMTLLQNGSIGIGTIPEAGFGLDVNGNVKVTPSGGIGDLRIGTPGGETGFTILGSNRADVRFNNSTLKLLAGPGTGVPPSTSGLAINTTGGVGIGTEVPTARLHILNNGGIAGVALRVVEQSADGTAISATGNVRQDLNSNGLVKAMVYVDANGGIVRCYNAITNSSIGNCGFSITRNIGSWWIDFGFQVNNRFWSGTVGIGITNIGLQAHDVDTNVIAVKLFQTDLPNSSGENVFRNFMLIVY